MSWDEEDPGKFKERPRGWDDEGPGRFKDLPRG